MTGSDGRESAAALEDEAEEEYGADAPAGLLVALDEGTHVVHEPEPLGWAEDDAGVESAEEAAVRVRSG